MRYNITKYTYNNKKYATSWFQINIFNKNLCFFSKTIEI